MHTFRVWAPLPRLVEVQVGAGRYPMDSQTDGWWTAAIMPANAGDVYGFILDGEGPFPDPRSPSQPNGVHHLSQLADANGYCWQAVHWQPPPLASAIFYELHVGTFTPAGTFLSTIEKLGHLVALGVTHVELMPIAEYDGKRGWGYDAVDLFAPHHHYGRPDDLRQLVDACHQHGLAVVLDVVYNHLGPSGNYLAKFGPYFTKRYAPTWGAALNYDGADNENVRRFFCDNALMWLRDFQFDGLRLDAVHAIHDGSAQPFLEQLKLEVEQLSVQLDRRLVLIPESDLNDPRLLWPRERGGFALDAQWSDDFHHALHAVLTGETNGYYADFGKLEDLATALQQAFVYAGKYSPYRRHRHGRLAESLGGHRFLGYLQNHDQIGNRPHGDRCSHLLTVGKLKVGAALVLASPFLPLLFQGEEWGASTPFLYFTDYHEPVLGRAVQEGRCRDLAALGWRAGEVPHPQAESTFERSKLNWSELSNPPQSKLMQWHQQLIRLRKTETWLHDGRLEQVMNRFDELAGWFVMERGAISVVCNLANAPRSIPIRSGEHQLLLGSEPGMQISKTTANLPPESVVILKLD